MGQKVCLMSDKLKSSLGKRLEYVVDPRVEGRGSHKLIDMTIIDICGAMCGGVGRIVQLLRLQEPNSRSTFQHCFYFRFTITNLSIRVSNMAGIGQARQRYCSG